MNRYTYKGKRKDNGKWVLENTEDNKKTLLKEIYKRFMEEI